MQRTVGLSIEEIDDLELVLVGSNVAHGWKMHKCDHAVYEVTIQFHNDLFTSGLTKRRIMKPLKEMLDNAVHGISFDKRVIKELEPRLTKISEQKGFDYLMALFTILYDLSTSHNQRLLSIARQPVNGFQNSDKLKRFYDFIQKNYSQKITLEQIAAMMSMSKVSFNRFIKKSTNRTFVEYLNEVRIENASIQLTEQVDKSISHIAFDCGFQNIANFNRTFKRIKGCTPSAYRKKFQKLMYKE